ncbi:MAG TPA: NADH-quinone oxidoreductase subunit L [Elusimicrobiota bacterium]|nr:NADH-quinone oxidoreductase subunit L [Elusimicrobiota bacterium]
MIEHAWLIPVLPLLASVLIVFLGRWLLLDGAWIGILCALWGVVQSAGIVIGLFNGHGLLLESGLTGHFHEMSFPWFQAGFLRLELGCLIDGMSALMMLVVTAVSFLVQVYSLSYQRGKPRFGRYYATLSLFTFAMLLLVISNNMFQFFVGWELVGVCSYLLIGFEFERDAAAAAGRKAFITTKIGDLGFYVGLLLLFSSVGTLNIPIIQREFVSTGILSPELCCAIALLLFCGAIGKSAQVPLHVWLPDAMEGPTPVSALIHAATMVAAGVYLVARLYFLFAVSPFCLTVVAWVGALTALTAALNALVASDIKRVLAFSTVSQLGYMMLSLGCGGYRAGFFHLTTHAFFKALLFLGAGSVIHAVHTNDIWKMGGLSKKMPVTFLTFGAATLAIIGFPGFAGFFSKEEILASVAGTHQTALFLVAAFTAFLTAFYMSRVFFVVFLGDPRDPHRFAEAHESDWLMGFPMVVLAVMAVLSGFFLTYVWPLSRWIPGVEGHLHQMESLVLSVSVGALALGAGLAYSIYRRSVPDPAVLAVRWRPLDQFLRRRFADELYAALIEKCVFAPARHLARFDEEWIDRFVVDGVGTVSRRISVLKAWADDVLVDRFCVNGWGWLADRCGRGLRRLQTGLVQFYLLVIAFGLSLFLLWAVRVYG